MLRNIFEKNIEENKKFSKKKSSIIPYRKNFLKKFYKKSWILKILLKTSKKSRIAPIFFFNFNDDFFHMKKNTYKNLRLIKILIRIKFLSKKKYIFVLKILNILLYSLLTLAWKSRFYKKKNLLKKLFIFCYISQTKLLTFNLCIYNIIQHYLKKIFICSLFIQKYFFIL